MNPLDQFPTFEQWAFIKEQVDSLPPLPVKQAPQGLDSHLPIAMHDAWQSQMAPPTVMPIVPDWQTMVYEMTRKQREAEYQRKMRAMQREKRKSGEAKNGDDFWNQISRG